MIGIADRSIAFSFDMRCGEMLLQFEAERAVEQEQRQLEALSLGAVTNMLGGDTKPKVSVTQKREEGSF